MNIIINTEEFVNHLSKVVGVVDRKQTMPILGHVLITGSSGEITITATDLEVQISSTFKANISEDFLITLPGRKLFDILRSLGNTELEISSDDDTILVLKTAKVSFPFNNYLAMSFHCLITQKANQTFTIKQQALSEYLIKHSLQWHNKTSGFI